MSPSSASRAVSVIGSIGWVAWRDQVGCTNDALAGAADEVALLGYGVHRAASVDDARLGMRDRRETNSGLPAVHLTHADPEGLGAGDVEVWGPEA
jgi:hypothetical protein